MSKFISRSAFVPAAGYSGALAKTQRGQLWDALQVLGLTDTNRVTVTATATLTLAQCGLLLVDASAAAIVLTLPASGAAADEAMYNLRRIDSSANTVTVQRAGTDTVEGGASITLPGNSTTSLQIPGGSANWRVAGISGPTAAAARAALGSAASGANSDITSLTTLASINGGQLAGLRNRIINGAMNIDQRNSGAAITVTTQVAALDRFGVANTTATGTLTVQQSTVAGFGKSLKATATAAITALTTTLNARPCYHVIEAQNCFDLNAKTVTISFTVETNWAGNLAVSVRNSGNTRSYVTNVAVVSGINTRSVVVPLEAATIATNDNAAGLNIDIGFCNEATFQTATTGSWLAGDFRTATTSTQWCKTLSNFVNITQLQLEQGAVATPFEQRPIGLELALCQRYAFKLGGAGLNETIGYGFANNGGAADAMVVLPQTMRALPTLIISSLGHFVISNGAVGTSITAMSITPGLSNASRVGINSTASAAIAAQAVNRLEAGGLSASLVLTAEYF